MSCSPLQRMIRPLSKRALRDEKHRDRGETTPGGRRGQRESGGTKETEKRGRRKTDRYYVNCPSLIRNGEVRHALRIELGNVMLPGAWRGRWKVRAYSLRCTRYEETADTFTRAVPALHLHLDTYRNYEIAATPVQTGAGLAWWCAKKFRSIGGRDII